VAEQPMTRSVDKRTDNLDTRSGKHVFYPFKEDKEESCSVRPVPGKHLSDATSYRPIPSSIALKIEMGWKTPRDPFSL
jgi:hypothetical protein